MENGIEIGIVIGIRIRLSICIRRYVDRSRTCIRLELGLPCGMGGGEGARFLKGSAWKNTSLVSITKFHPVQV